MSFRESQSLCTDWCLHVPLDRTGRRSCSMSRSLREVRSFTRSPLATRNSGSTDRSIDAHREAVRPLGVTLAFTRRDLAHVDGRAHGERDHLDLVARRDCVPPFVRARRAAHVLRGQHGRRDVHRCLPHDRQRDVLRCDSVVSQAPDGRPHLATLDAQQERRPDDALPGPMHRLSRAPSQHGQCVRRDICEWQRGRGVLVRQRAGPSLEEGPQSERVVQGGSA